MKNITKEMLKIYKPYSGLDWLNYRLIKKDITFHHIIKKEHGGEKTIENGALLMPTAHQYLHLIECKDMETYTLLNRVFRMINDQYYEPTREQRELIEFFLRRFESEHKNDKGARGTLLIKHKYLERDL